MYCNECGKYFEGVGDYCPRCAQKLGLSSGYDIAERGLGLGIIGDTGDARSSAKDKAVGVGQIVVGLLVVGYAVWRLVLLGGAVPGWPYANTFAEAMQTVTSRVGLAELFPGGDWGYAAIFAAYILVGALLVFSGAGSVINASGLALSKAANLLDLLVFFYVLGSGAYLFVVWLTRLRGAGFYWELGAVVTMRAMFDIACSLVILIFVGSYNIAKKRRARENGALK